MRDSSYLIGNQHAKGRGPNKGSFKKGHIPYSKGLKGIYRKPRYAEDFRQKVIEDAKVMGLVAAAKANNITPQSLILWCKKIGLSFRHEGRKINCAVCGKKITVSEKGHRECCSRECRREFDNKKVTCAYCRKVFIVQKAVIRKFCSHECYSKSRRTNPQERKRRGSNWNTIRRRFKKNPGLCELCQIKTAEDLHHIIPFKYFNGDFERANEKTNLVALCKDCHHKTEGYVRRIFKIISKAELINA